MDELSDLTTPLISAVVLDFLSPNSFLRNTVMFTCGTPKSSLRIVYLLLAGYVDELYLTKEHNQSYFQICVFLGVLVGRRVLFFLWYFLRLLIVFAWKHVALLFASSLFLGIIWRYGPVSWRRRIDDAWLWLTLWMILGPTTVAYQTAVFSKIISNGITTIIRAIADFLSPSPSEFSYSSAPDFDPSSQIRLLKLHRKIPFLGVSAELVSHKIHNAPPYHAISYVWTYGAQDIRSFTLNGKTMCIRGNVYDILERCSSFFGPCFIWIDTICIDQTSVSEKTLQVRKMQEIYGKCAHVLICLGDKPSYLALSLIREMEMVRSVMGDAYLVNHVGGFFERRKTDIYLRDRIAALQELLQHPWFRRIWVVQEVVVPLKVMMYYGNKSISWMEFYGWMKMFTGPMFTLFSSLGADVKSVNGLMETGSSYIGTLSLPLIVAYRMEYHSLGPQTISHLLRVFGEREATFSIDKVYALIGMAKRYRDTDLKQLVDYDASTQDVLLRIADFILDHDEILDVLDCAGIGKREYNSSLPSWVVDWTIMRAGLPLNSKFAPPHVQYQASGDRPSKIVRGNPRKELIIRGQFVDRIHSVVTILDMATMTEQASESPMLAMATYMDKALTAAKNHAADPYTHLGNQPLEEAVWRTLIGDKTHTERPAPASYAQGWRTQMQFLVDLQRYHDIPDPNLMFTDRSTHERMQKELGEAKILEIQRANQEFQEYDLLFDTGKGQSQYVFCVTERGYIGMVPPFTKEGDCVVLVFGSGVPFVLRKVEDGGERWKIVGDAYVHGIMDGEGLQTSHVDEDFTIV